MSFNLYFTGVLTGFVFAAYCFSAVYDAAQYWRTAWIFALGGMCSISAMYFAGYEREVVGAYYLVFVWLTIVPIHYILSRAPTSMKLPWYLKAWFYGGPPFLGVRFGLQIIQYTNNQNRGFGFWSSVVASVFTLTVYVLSLWRLSRMIARERTLMELFPDDKEPLQ